MNSFMLNDKKMKYVFIGDIDSINIELIIKSHKFLRNKLKYIILCDKYEFYSYLKEIKSKVVINEILDPIKFIDYKEGLINLFNIENKF